MEDTKPLKVIIIGGSLTGLFIGILLKRQGHDVHILERSTEAHRESLAAGIGLAAHVKRFFAENDKLNHIALGIPVEHLRILDRDLNVKATLPLHYQMTTWDATYYRLRANFDALTSLYCPVPPEPDTNEGKSVFESGVSVMEVRAATQQVEVLVTDRTCTGALKTYEGDIAIAADGANSQIRRSLQGNLLRSEPGYVLWRGVVPVKDLSPSLLDKIDGQTCVYPLRYSYAMTYSVPGENGTLESGQTLINFVWYTWVSSAAELREIFTDCDGHCHRSTVPKGKMKHNVWQRQIAVARKILHSELWPLVESIKSPFVSLVSSTTSSRGIYLTNRLFFLGDALAQLQPNTGQGTNMAVMEATLLADAIAGKLSLEEWEEQVLIQISAESARAKWFASQWMSGWWIQQMHWLRWKYIVGTHAVYRWIFGMVYTGSAKKIFRRRIESQDE